MARAEPIICDVCGEPIDIEQPHWQRVVRSAGVERHYAWHGECDEAGQWVGRPSRHDESSPDVSSQPDPSDHEPVGPEG